MSKHSDKYNGQNFTFAEVAPDAKMEWLGGYLDTLATRAFTAQFGDKNAVQDLGADIQMAIMLLRQIRCQVVAESNAVVSRLHSHGDYVYPMVGHDLAVYFEPDGTEPEKDAPVTRRE